MNTNIDFKGYINDRDGYEYDFRCSASGDSDLEDFEIYDIEIVDQDDNKTKLKSLAFMPDKFEQSNINSLEECIKQAVVDGSPSNSRSEERDYWNYTQGR